MTYMRCYHRRSLIALLAPVSLFAQTRARVDVYSSMRYIEEAGDVVGVELLIVQTPHGACASYQIGEGAPGPVRIVPVTMRGDSLAFTIPPDSGYDSRHPKDLIEAMPARAFRGRISVTGIRAITEENTKSTWLPRRKTPYYRESLQRLQRMAGGRTSAVGTSWCK